MRKPIEVNRPELKRIYADVGGESGLKRILDDFYSRLAKDLLVGFFFEGKDIGHIAEMQRKFLMRAMGAVPTYSGKPPAQAHLELAPILSGHFDRRLRLLEDTLRDHGVPEEDIRTWITFEEAFREGIVSDDPAFPKKS